MRPNLPGLATHLDLGLETLRVTSCGTPAPRERITNESVDVDCKRCQRTKRYNAMLAKVVDTAVDKMVSTLVTAETMADSIGTLLVRAADSGNLTLNGRAVQSVRVDSVHVSPDGVYDVDFAVQLEPHYVLRFDLPADTIIPDDT